MANRVRESFETRTGFTVSGTEVTDALLEGLPGHCDVFPENGATQIRVCPLASSNSVVIRFEDGSGTCLAALPGYIGAVTVQDGRLVNVSFAHRTIHPALERLSDSAR